MKGLAVGVVIALAIVTTSHASCRSDAADKKLAGAALNSFMKKCASDAKASCETSSAELKLVGAAKTSHLKKCVADAVGK